MTDKSAAAWGSLPILAHVHASGDWAFFTWAGLREAEDVYAVRLDGSTPPERLTTGADHYSIRDVSPDGMRLILGQSRNSCEHDHLLLLDRSTGALTQLTPEQSSHYVYGGIFSADGQDVIFTANFDYEAGEVTLGGWVWRQSLATGARRCLARSGSPFETGPKLSPSGRQLLWHRHERAPAGTQLWVMGEHGEGLREVLNLGAANNAHGVWLDEDRIGFVADVEAQDRLGVLTLSSGAVEWLAGEPGLYPFEVIAGAKGFACVTHDQGNTRCVLVEAGVIRPLPNLSGRRSLLPHASLPDGGWIAEAYDASAPHQLVRVHPDGHCTTLVTPEPNPDRQHIAPRDYRWTAQDGRAVQGWLYQPEGASKGFIAYVHGGPTWHSEDWVNPKIGYWVQKGYTVLDPNYRGSTGFGYAHREAVKDDGWGGREQGDIRAGIEQALADGIAVRGRIGMAGNSYGGFSSWFGITRHADLVTAAIPMCGMYRLDIDYHATEMPHGRAYSIEMMGGTPEEFPEKYDNASPGQFIDQIRGDLLIVHGLADSNVGPDNTHMAVRELTAAGIAHQVMLFDDEGHGVFRPANVARYLEASDAFFAAAFAKAKP
mgnify:CR=1 FL=1